MTQGEYLSILFADCGYDTAKQRKGWIDKRFGVSHVDELSTWQRSIAISMLKDEKEKGMPEEENDD